MAKWRWWTLVEGRRKPERTRESLKKVRAYTSLSRMREREREHLGGQVEEVKRAPESKAVVAPLAAAWATQVGFAEKPAG